MAERERERESAHLCHPPLLSRSAYILPISPMPMMPIAVLAISSGVPDGTAGTLAVAILAVLLGVNSRGDGEKEGGLIG